MGAPAFEQQKPIASFSETETEDSVLNTETRDWKKKKKEKMGVRIPWDLIFCLLEVNQAANKLGYHRLMIAISRAAS
jgi:hypothetical protein